MSLADYGENYVLDRILGSGTPATWYLALLETAATDASTGATLDEPESAEYSTYTRLAITNNVTNFPAATGGQKKNGTILTFPTLAGGNTGFTAVGWALVDSGTIGAGNVLCYATHAGVAIPAGVAPYYAVNALTFTLS